LIRGKEKLKKITRNQHYVTRAHLNEILKYKDRKSKDQAMYKATSSRLCLKIYGRIYWSVLFYSEQSD